MKRSVHRFVFTLGLMGLCSAGLGLAPAHAQDNAGNKAGEAALAKVDAALNAYETLLLGYEMINREPGQPVKKLKLQVRAKGDKQLSELLAPPDMKGTKVLALSATQMYVYLPQFKKIRRIASHVSDVGFLGTAVSQADMNLKRYTPFYTAKLRKDGTLVLTARAGKKAPYARIEMEVSKKLQLPTTLRYFNGKGKHVKTETRTGYKCQGKVCNAKELEMVDHTKGDHSTTFVLKKWKTNVPMKDKLFSKRSLLR